MRETDLYPPVKAFLEAQGYAVKGEVDGCDLVAVRGDEPPVIVELKAGFSLPLAFQGITRQGLTDNVYLAVPPFSGRTTRRRDALALCRRLGLGLLAVRLEPAPLVEALLDPAQYRPRKRPQRLVRLLREFQHRVGDPNQGGSSRRKIVTAYRQDALRCASHLHQNGPTKAAVVAQAVGVVRAGVITTRRRDALALCRRLGLGLLAVQLEPAPLVEALLDPAQYRPRRRPQRLVRLLREFQRRVGDPNQGGSSRGKIVTAYRQDALRCASHLHQNGPTKAAVVAQAVGVVRAGVIMRTDHYGWFERPAGTPRGVYGLTPKGRAALEEYADVVAEL